MNVQDIVREYLVANGYDGLAGDGCGCGINELFSCGDPNSECRPAHSRACLGTECGCCELSGSSESVMCYWADEKEATK